LGSQVSGVVETEVWIASASNSAARDKGHTGALYSKNGDRAAEVGMALFTTALDLYGGVLWSDELQGFIANLAKPISLGQMGQNQNLLLCAQLGAARSRQDESKEVVKWGRNGRLQRANRSTTFGGVG
jgi:hypothetical protein